MTDFVRHTAELARKLESLRQRNSSIDVSALEEALARATATLDVPNEIQELPAWKQLVSRAQRWRAGVGDSSSPAAAYRAAKRYWNGVPVKAITRVLRRHNLKNRGLDAVEIKELGDINRFPGTILGELQERYWRLQNTAATVK
jgi:hypothetical protein